VARPQAGAVFKYLVAHRGRVVQTDELIEAFWATPARAGDRSVRQAIHTLRDRLEPDREKRAGSTFIAARSGGYELERSVVWIDADDFEASVADGLKAMAPASSSRRRPRSPARPGLYRGPRSSPRRRTPTGRSRARPPARARRARRCARSRRSRRRSGDLDGATEQLSRLAELEQYDVDIQRALIALLLRRGRRAEAVRRYEVFRHRHRKAFAEDPGFDLADVAAQVSTA
jgi:DNA-binding SARP family transcriptional activator